MAYRRRSTGVAGIRAMLTLDEPQVENRRP
jgi:hypothetical protein